jgi:hypothetical protein
MWFAIGFACGALTMLVAAFLFVASTTKVWMR